VGRAPDIADVDRALVGPEADPVVERDVGRREADRSPLHRVPDSEVLRRAGGDELGAAVGVADDRGCGEAAAPTTNPVLLMYQDPSAWM
jgi:hypothetical protein